MDLILKYKGKFKDCILTFCTQPFSADYERNSENHDLCTSDLKPKYVPGEIQDLKPKYEGKFKDCVKKESALNPSFSLICSRIVSYNGEEAVSNTQTLH